MGLSSVKALAKPERPSSVDIDLAVIGAEGKLTFRAPRVSDFFPKAEMRNEAAIAFPMIADADPSLATQFFLMVLCYQPEPEEKDSPMRVFGGLMRDNLEAFLTLVGEFGSRFPLSLGAAKEQAGNASGQ